MFIARSLINGASDEHMEKKNNNKKQQHIVIMILENKLVKFATDIMMLLSLNDHKAFFFFPFFSRCV